MNKWIIKHLTSIVIGGIFILWLLNLFLVVLMKVERPGEVGDLFGAVNALFSGLGFVAIYFTLRLQQGQIKHQEEETVKQNFEAAFFSLLNSYEVTRRNFSESIDKMFKFLAEYIVTRDQASIRLKWTRSFENLPVEAHSNSHFTFNQLALLADFVNSSSVKNKGFYLDIVRSRIYEKDVVLLYVLIHHDVPVGYFRTVNRHLLTVELLDRYFPGDSRRPFQRESINTVFLANV